MPCWLGRLHAGCQLVIRPRPHPGGAFQGAKRQRAFARPLEPHQPPRWANRTPLGCRDRKHPPLGCGLVVRHPDMGKSRPHRAHAEASRWPILAPMSALPATGAGRWARHGPRGPMGSVGSGLAPLGPARHLPGPTIGLRGASDGPFRPPGFWLLHPPWPFGSVSPPAGVGPSRPVVA